MRDWTHRLSRLGAVAAVLLHVSVLPASAQDTVSITGFVEPEARAYISKTHPEWLHSTNPDARIELRAYPSDWVDAAIVGELDTRYADVITPEVNASLRELWVRFYEGPLTVGLGKQIHTWGTIQEFGVVDILNPQEFPDLTQDHTNRKLGVWTLKSGYDLGFMQAELYVMPWFTPSQLPTEGAFAEASLPRPLQRAVHAEVARAEQAARDAEQELQSGWEQLEAGQAQLDDGYVQIGQARDQLDTAEAQAMAQLQAVQAMPDSPQKFAALAELQAGLAQIAQQRAGLEREEATLDREQAQLDQQREFLNAAEAELAGAEGESRRAWEGAMADPTRIIPPREPRSTQVAGRLYFPLAIGDFSLGVARLYDQIGTVGFQPGPNPGDAPRLTIEHPRLTASTVSGAIPLGSFSIRFEGLYLHTADPAGTDPFIRNPTLQSAGQIIWDPTSELSIRAGVQDEQIFAVNDDEERADEYSLPSPVGSTLLLLADHIAHTAVTYRWGTSMHELMLAYLWAYEADGHLVQPEIDLAVVSGVRLRLGAQFYAGRDDRRGFGKLRDQDNVYLAARASF